MAAGKALAWGLGVPLVGVDHVHAHLYAGLMAEGDAAPPEVALPALGLVVSGGHTTMYAVGCESGPAGAGVLGIERLGGTIDDALGEAYDKAASLLGLGFPGGPALDRLACEDGADERAVDLPVSRLGPSSLDFSFSGLKTALLYAATGGPAGGAPALDAARRRNLAASFQRAAVSAVMLKLGRAIDGLEQRGRRVRTLLAGGGVTSNSRLRAELAGLAAKRGLRLVLPPPALCVDNAAMIAGLGHEMLRAGVRHGLERASPDDGVLRSARALHRRSLRRASSGERVAGGAAAWVRDVGGRSGGPGGSTATRWRRRSRWCMGRPG